MGKYNHLRISIIEQKIGLMLVGTIGLTAIVLFMVGMQIEKNALDISQIYHIIKTQFPDQELYSAVQYVAHSSKLNLTLYIVLSVVDVAMMVSMVILFRKVYVKRLSKIAALEDEVEQLRMARPLRLPQELDTECAQKYLKKALDGGLLYTKNDKLKRVEKNCSKAQLAYLVRRIYCPNLTEQLPEKALNVFFDESRIGEAVLKLNKNNGNKPKDADVIDTLFVD